MIGEIGESEAAGYADVGPALLDRVEGVPDGVEPRGAAGGDGLHRPAGLEAFRDRRGEGAGRECPVQMRPGLPVVHVPALPAVADQDVVVLQTGGATDRRAQGDTDPPGVLRGEVETGVQDRLLTGHQGELDVPVAAGDLLRVQSVGRRVEVALGGDPRTQPGRVEEGDAACRRATVGQQVPERRDTDAARSDDAYAGDRHAPGHERT